MRLPRGLGWIPDDPVLVAAQQARSPFSVLEELLPGEPRSTVSYAACMLGGIPDQGGTSSCVGFAFSTALFIIAAIAGTPIPRPSSKLIYDFARAEDRPYSRLLDLGSRPVAAANVLTTKGMVADADWALRFMPDGTSNVNQRPYLDVFQTALAYRLGSYYRISAGGGASAAVRRALDRRLCPVFAMPVDAAYQRHTSGIYEGRKGASLGGHMQAFCGYGDGYLEVVTSWGETHGERGIVRIANDYVDSGECTDIITPTLLPALRAA